MKRKNDKLELILLGVGILLLLLLFVVKRRLDAPEETATAESRTETMEGKKQEETIQNMEQENAAFLNSKKEEQKDIFNEVLINVSYLKKVKMLQSVKKAK